jgi:serine/threonine protein kinase
MGAYYVTDWVLRQTGDFTANQIAGDDAGLSLDATLRMSSDKVEELLTALADNGLIEKLWSPDANHTMIGDASQAVVYRLSERTRRSLRAFVRGNERERIELAPVPPSPAAEAAPASIARSPWQETDDHEAIGDRYELLEPIGRGGMGTVYRARDRRQPRVVAIKMLDSPSLFADGAMRARFHREAEIATSLRHPNIVRSYELIQEPARLAIVMELVEGTSLRSAIQARSLSPFEAIEITRRLLDALDYAASLNVARFDIKPENVVLRTPTDPVMIDFGIVKRVVVGSDRFTETGTALGTPTYMAPEQALGSAAIDIRSDLYALALVLGEVLAGRPVREEEDSPMAMLYRAVHEDVDLSFVPASSELTAVLSRALAREPQDRFGTPSEMSVALASVPEAQPDITGVFTLDERSPD